MNYEDCLNTRNMSYKDRYVRVDIKDIAKADSFEDFKRHECLTNFTEAVPTSYKSHELRQEHTVEIQYKCQERS